MSKNPSVKILTADASRNTLRSSRPQSGMDFNFNRQSGLLYSRPQSGISYKGKCNTLESEMGDRITGRSKTSNENSISFIKNYYNNVHARVKTSKINKILNNKHVN